MVDLSTCVRDETASHRVIAEALSGCTWSVDPTLGETSLLIVTDLERWAAEVIAFYTASLPDSFVEPDLDFFADFYLDSARKKELRANGGIILTSACQRMFTRLRECCSGRDWRGCLWLKSRT